jgi:hypothetical protein
MEPRISTEPALWAVRSTGLILIEAPSSAYPSSMLRVGKSPVYRGGDRRRCDTKPPPFYCALDRHARTMSGCILRQDGDLGLHRHRPAGPDAWLQALAPERDALGLAVAGLLPGYGRADRWAQAGRPVGLGPALSMQALQGGQATNATRDSQPSAVLRRGGLRPQA